MHITTIIVLSTSEIKKKAIQKYFMSDKYKLIFIDVPEDDERQSQPLFISGTKLACQQRVKQFKKLNLKLNIQLNNCYIISIENGMLSIDENSENSENSKLENKIWADFCTIGLIKITNNIESEINFTIAPCVIAIEKKYTETYFKHHYNTNTNMDTFGKFIACTENPIYEDSLIKHNNWMKHICKIDRIEQIGSGLIIIKKIIEQQ